MASHRSGVSAICIANVVLPTPPFILMKLTTVIDINDPCEPPNRGYSTDSQNACRYFPF